MIDKCNQIIIAPHAKQAKQVLASVSWNCYHLKVMIKQQWVLQNGLNGFITLYWQQITLYDTPDINLLSSDTDEEDQFLRCFLKSKNIMFQLMCSQIMMMSIYYVMDMEL